MKIILTTSLLIALAIVGIQAQVPVCPGINSNIACTMDMNPVQCSLGDTTCTYDNLCLGTFL